jgi:hypothetical protein
MSVPECRRALRCILVLPLLAAQAACGMNDWGRRDAGSARVVTAPPVIRLAEESGGRNAVEALVSARRREWPTGTWLDPRPDGDPVRVTGLVRCAGRPCAGAFVELERRHGVDPDFGYSLWGGGDLPPLAVPPGASHGPPLSAWVGR